MGCSTWWYLNQCLNTNAGPDLMFSLNGKVTTLPKP
jgi:hypothetical protein